MKRNFFTLILLSLLFIITHSSYSQCVPLTSDECPDLENNGEVCPDTLSPAFINQLYSQVATILPPSVYITEDSVEIELHSVHLMEVANLPEGITWQSNTEDSVFMAGEYYCILMEGTPDSAGEYALRIVVDVYILFFGIPVKVATAVDSTSLTLIVVDNTGINDDKEASFHAGHNIPNPFKSETRIGYYADKAGPATFEVYSLVGERVHSEQIHAGEGENLIVFDGRRLSAGTYFYILRRDNYQSAGIMIRAD